MEKILTIPKCPNCGSDLEERPTKTGGKYYACPKWKPNNAGCKGYKWFPPSDKSRGSYGRNNDAVVEGLRAIYKEIAEINIAVKMFLSKK